MSYSKGATSINKGDQLVTVHPYQELSSLNANKTFLGLLEPGVYQVQIEIQDTGGSVVFVIKKGTTLIFKKKDAEYNTDLLGKVYLQDDASVSITKSSLLSLMEDSIMIVASWEYSVNNTNEIFVNFRILGYEASNISDLQSYNDLLIAVCLNHREVRENSGNISYYHIAYQETTYRNALNNVFSVSSNFQATHGWDGKSIIIGSGACILGDTFIYNKSTLTVSVANGNWPQALSTNSPTNYYQVDVLRIKTETATDTVKQPYLAWESFLKDKPMTDMESFLDGYNFVFKDIGYTVLVAIRDRATLTGNTPIWPSDCLYINPFMAQIGNPETSSRFKFPIY
jgi:hypothetical protein